MPDLSIVDMRTELKEKNNSIFSRLPEKVFFAKDIVGLWALKIRAWVGDALDNLYNVGGAGQWSDGSETWHSGLTYPSDYTNKNQMVIGLANGYAYNGGNTWDGKPWGTPGADTTPTGYAARVRFGLNWQLHP